MHSVPTLKRKTESLPVHYLNYLQSPNNRQSTHRSELIALVALSCLWSPPVATPPSPVMQGSRRLIF